MRLLQESKGEKELFLLTQIGSLIFMYTDSKIHSPGLGQWLACSPVSTQTWVRYPVEAYVNCSSLLWYNLITRVRPCLMN